MQWLHVIYFQLLLFPISPLKSPEPWRQTKLTKTCVEIEMFLIMDSNTTRCDSYEATVRLIEAARLTPTEHSIWRAFLNEAIDPEYAAQYIWDRINDSSGRPPEQVLDELKSN